MHSTTVLATMPAEAPTLEDQLASLEARLDRIEAELLATPGIGPPLSTMELAAIERAIAEHCH
ncbi:MAG: hypothetical protein J0M00_07085 [Burkholderiales bacterium]|nr:hypothetical protein [Burkholderiales bacterium]